MKPETCQSCGCELGTDAPDGLCPRCLMGQVMAGQEAPTGRSALAPGPTAADVERLLPGYADLELLGDGGMGVVYRAHHRKLDREVAIKVLRPALSDEAGFADRFLREARALARLDHPGVVKVFDFGESSNLFYFVMEYVDGTNLRSLLAGSQLPPERALAIVPQVCDALQYAHGHGVVHRDIKPENILIDREGRVKIADFGLAKIAGREGESAHLTGTGQVMGTPHYMAPEQVTSPRSVDHRADIFSLGVVLYEMLTGELPLGRFAAPSTHAASAVGNAGLDKVVMRALEREPDRRYQQASEVRSDVEAAAHAAEPRPVAAPVRRAKRGIGPAVVLGCTGLAIAAFVVVAAGLFLVTRQRAAVRMEDERAHAEAMAEYGRRLRADADLNEAARAGDLDGVESALRYGAHPDALVSEDSAPPICHAIAAGDPAMVRALLEAGAVVYGPTGEWSPLQIAGASGNVAVIELLLDTGIDPDDHRQWDETVERNLPALHLAAEGGHADAVDLLARRGGDLDSWIEGAAPLTRAARNGHVEVIALLVEKGIAPASLAGPIEAEIRAGTMQPSEIAELVDEHVFADYLAKAGAAFDQLRDGRFTEAAATFADLQASSPRHEDRGPQAFRSGGHEYRLESPTLAFIVGRVESLTRAGEHEAASAVTRGMQPMWPGGEIAVLYERRAVDTGDPDPEVVRIGLEAMIWTGLGRFEEPPALTMLRGESRERVRGLVH